MSNVGRFPENPKENYKNIPEELQKLNRWICYCLHWDAEKNGGAGGYTKPPINPHTLRNGSSTNPKTWSDVDTAIAQIGKTCLYTNGKGEAVECKVDGIGFAFEGSGYFGIDLDHVFDDGFITAPAQDIVTSADSYSEISPSGTGIHILCKGTIPAGRRKVKNADGTDFEIYNKGRYFTVTGKVYGDAKPVQERTAQAAAIHKRYFPQEKPQAPRQEPQALTNLDDGDIITRAHAAKNGADFARLWNGDTSGHGSDDSAADLALCNMLAFWTGRDMEQMDGLFRASGLMRDKWDRAQSGSTYGAITMQKAIDDCKKVYDPAFHHPTTSRPNEAASGENREGEPCASYDGEHISIDVVKAVLRDLGYTVRQNQLLKEVEIKGLPKQYSANNAVNVLPVLLIDKLKQSKVKGATPQAVDGYLSCIADENRFNPIEELLAGERWDGGDRIREACEILGITIDRHKTYLRKWLIQCIALGLNSETRPVGAEGVLVLQGEQGLAKTSFFRIISPYPRWFCEGAVIDVTDKDTIMKATGAWITELGELDSTLKREQSALKAFITSTDDNIRAPYAKNATRTPRRTSFCGTVNPADYLRDETGSRRFWTIPVTNIDKQRLFALSRSWVFQLWAQAYSLYQEDNNGFRLTNEETAQLQADNKGFSVPLPFETEIKELLDYSLPFDEWEWWKAREIRELLPPNADAVRVGKALKKVVEWWSSVHFSTTPSTPQSTRKSRGMTEYFIPLKHCDG